jgi:hypothetical protein
MAVRPGAGGTEITGGGGVDADRHVMVNIDRVPPPARHWFEKALARLKASPGCPEQVTDGAHQLEADMHEAHLRRQVDKAWGWGYIKTRLISLGYWKRKRPQR